jgi:hypothetical protein
VAEDLVSIPLATTTVRVERARVDPTRDGYDPKPALGVVVSGVRAHLSAPTGTEILAGGSKQRIDRHLDCDPTDVRHYDEVVDEVTGLRYQVVWTESRTGLGLDRVEAGLRRVEGVA